MVKYAGEGMEKYFDLKDARVLFHKINPSTIRILFPHQKEQISLIDGSNLSSQYKELFVSLRSAYLTFQHGREHIVESYSPHRFSRQYNFCQDIPGLLQKEILTYDLKELLQLWRSCTLLSTSSKLNLPGNTSSPPLVTKEYADWWTKFGLRSERQEYYEKALQSVQQSLTKAEPQKNEQAKDIKSRNDSLQRIHQQQEELKKQLAELGQNGEIVSISHRKAEEYLSKIREDVATQKETILKLEKTPYLSDREVKALERMTSLLEES
ncbi:hypothetical protein BUALT_Bualt06G0069100 [Buddleja alternifolia]|uniref:Uncharacterized protein n=1 Tax=Buddleja alternifolia TaxID=168488 RepID=A0AAV6XES4_9LAMI|nr:hypothetical protein BUALT_Bualt06G0069100 [Buddleja alternifolia]